MRGMIRGIIDSVIEGAIKRISGKGLAAESFSNREYFQHYGFTSRPLAGGEYISIREGNHIVAVASDDRRYRLHIESGEVALYDDQGQRVHMQRDKTIRVSGTDHLVADVGVDSVVTCPLVTVAASTKVRLETPLVECTQDLTVGGNMTVALNGQFGGGLTMTGAAGSGNINTPGDISDGVRSMAGDRDIHNLHDHPGDSGGTTGPPNQTM